MRYRTLWLTAAASAALGLACGISSAQISIGVSVHVAPPALPVYEQPVMPAAGYLWVPGYWAWDDNGYYWVPGEWVLPPRAGLLWTPGYWAWDDGAYVWNEGYWAPRIGFYGGVNYGYGYTGTGYVGGYWSHGAFYYNNAVNHFAAGARIPHVYHHDIPRVAPGHVSFNGGPGGVRVHATAAQLTVQHGPHVVAVASQREQAQTAQRTPHHGGGNAHGGPAQGGPAGHAAEAPRAAPTAERHIPERHIPDHAGPPHQGGGAESHNGAPAHGAAPPQHAHEAAPEHRPQHDQQQPH